MPTDPIEAALKDLRERIAQKLDGYSEVKNCTPNTPEARLICATQFAAAASVREVPLFPKAKQFVPEGE